MEEMGLLNMPEPLVAAMLRVFSGDASGGDMFAALLRGFQPGVKR